jgi:hypothetical protein
MLFDEYLSRVIQWTEDRALVLSRQSEAWSCFCQASSPEFCGEFLISIGRPASPKDREFPNL